MSAEKLARTKPVPEPLATVVSASGCAGDDLTLSTDFWSQFAECYWEKSPVVIKRPFDSPFITREDAFDALVRAGSNYKPGDGSRRLRFYIETALLTGGVPGHLPREKDRSVDGYLERLTDQLGGRQFELIAVGVQEHSSQIWMRLREFFYGLCEQTGLPSQSIDASLFLRNHEKTSFGVHKDTSGAFVFVLEGKKRFVVWPYEVFAGRGCEFSTTEYEPYLSQAIILEGEPGDIIYWPSSYWHTGEADGRLSLSLNVLFDLSNTPSAELLKVLPALLEDELSSLRAAQTGEREQAGSRQGDEQMPDELRRAALALRHVANGPLVEDKLRLVWLNRITASGFTRVPAPLPLTRLEDAAVIKANSRFPVVRVEWDDTRLALSANGHSFLVPAFSSVPDLICHINYGERLEVKSAVERHARHGEEELLRQVLDKLHSLRAIEVV